MDEFKKKFTLGLNSNIPYKEYDEFLKKYKEYIHSVYFSLPIGDEFSTRQIYSDGLRTKEQIMNWWGLVDAIKSNDLKIEVCMNVVGLNAEKIDNAIAFMQQKLTPDEIVCITSYYAKLKEAFPNSRFIYSFNNIVPEKNRDSLEGFDEIVVGKSYLLSDDNRKKLINGGFPIRLLLNNGCFFECVQCNDMCRYKFGNDLSIFDVEMMYAKQSFWPEELSKLIKNVDYLDKLKFKLSTRTKNLKAQEICLSSYLQGENVEKYIKKDFMLYYIWCGLGYFSDYYKKFNFNRIRNIKVENNRF